MQAEAERIRHEIQSRSGDLATMNDASLDFRTQQAVNHASARQQGLNLDFVVPGTTINDGPYTEDHGPFEPNTSIELTDGTFVRIDEHGYPDADVNNDGVADPTTQAQATQATDEAAQSLQDARDMDVPSGLRHEKEEAIAHATTQVGDAVQQEIELGLRIYISANPEASEADIQAEAERLGHAILARDGNAGVVSEAQVDFRTDEAVAAVTRGE